jgi:hypothetical protein
MLARKKGNIRVQTEMDEQEGMNHGATGQFGGIGGTPGIEPASELASENASQVLSGNIIY